MPQRPTIGVGIASNLTAVTPQPVGLSRRGFLGIIGAATTALLVPGCGDSMDTQDTYNAYDGWSLAEELYKVEPLTRSITSRAGSTYEAVGEVVQWAQKNFFHYYREGPDEEWNQTLYENTELDIDQGPNLISIEDIFRERAVGCHYATGVVITMLRSIGIYAEYVQSNGHGTTYVPELDRYIHGDHVADRVATPAHELIMTYDELRYWVEHPGYPTDEPDGGYTNAEYLAFYPPMNEKYGYGPGGLRLRRKENALYIFGYLPAGTAEQSFALLSSLCPEYGLELGAQNTFGTIELVSQHIPIQPLTW